MKIALIVGRGIENTFKEEYFAVPMELTRLLTKSGYTSIFLGYETDFLKEFMTQLSPSLCVLIGGDSLGENIARDVFEYELLDISELLKIPVIGICRGMQVIASKKGSELNATSSHVGNQHLVFGKSEFVVNSYHNFSLSSCPLGFQEEYKASDGSIEAFSNESLKWYGIMWHPEREEIGSDGYRYMIDVLKKL